jgi:hypothetical protein
VLSEHSIQSEWVMTEIRKARETEKKEKRRKLFPIRLCDMATLQAWECFDADSGKDLAVEVREYFIPDFSNWKDRIAFEQVFARLKNDLEIETYRPTLAKQKSWKEPQNTPKCQMNPAAYPSRNTEEQEALRAFENLLDLKFTKPDLKRLDTRPNTDGTIEIVDEEQRPLGKIEVQVKKIPDGDTSYQCPIELIAYSERISLPFILVCVDVGNKKAYFRHLHLSMMPELKPNQQSFVVKFDPKVHSISSETQYRLQWLEIIQEYNKRISDYVRLRQIENQLNPAHISKEDRIYFQEFIEHLNHFLDFDFPIVKERLFKGVWKLGVGVSSADQNEVAYQIYTIYPGEPAILVSGIQERLRLHSAQMEGKKYFNITSQRART